MKSVPAAGAQPPPNFDLSIERVRTADLMPNPGNPRTHSPKQVSQLMGSILQHGLVQPLLIAEDNAVVCGHGRLLAASRLGYKEVPCIRISHLSEVQRRALALADNRIAEGAGWDIELLKVELLAIQGLDDQFDIELTGFDGALLDSLLQPDSKPDRADEIPPMAMMAVTEPGDVWVMNKHRTICGDARRAATYKTLMMSETARMVFADPPYNVRILGHVAGLGKTQHRPFVVASGELSEAQFRAFLLEALTAVIEVSQDGAIHFICMDWRSLRLLLDVGSGIYSSLKNLIAWVKTNGGMGTFYRSQHEMIAVFKVGEAPHINNFGLGDTGRYRTNVWQYAGVNSFGKGRDEALAMHPTVKPVVMVADAIKDVSKRGEIVLDPFGGSGTTLIAAEKTARRARLIELDPLYCDVICRRWEAFAGQPAILEATGQTFGDVAASRGASGT